MQGVIYKFFGLEGKGKPRSTLLGEKKSHSGAVQNLTWQHRQIPDALRLEQSPPWAENDGSFIFQRMDPASNEKTGDLHCIVVGKDRSNT